MRFYYFSLISWTAYIAIAGIGVFFLSLMWKKIVNLKFRNPMYWLLIAAIVIAPWGEELWISYNFDRLCRKDAGLFINKVVEVDGFYDDTKHWWRQLAESNYKFVESKDHIYKTLWRAERDVAGIRHFKIDQPAARYRYERRDGAGPVAHQIRRAENVVFDSQSGDVLGRYTNYARGPYWFYISLDAPRIGCIEAKGADPFVYEAVLMPTK